MEAEFQRLTEDYLEDFKRILNDALRNTEGEQIEDLPHAFNGLKDGPKHR